MSRNANGCMQVHQTNSLSRRHILSVVVKTQHFTNYMILLRVFNKGYMVLHLYHMRQRESLYKCIFSEFKTIYLRLHLVFGDGKHGGCNIS